MALIFAVLTLLFASQEAKEGTAGDAQKTVKIKRIVVEGTRLPALSVIHLAQIRAGDEVNFLKLHSALQKVTQSGLIKSIDFEYESAPDSETDVIVHLKCVDEKPSATATIQIPKVNEGDVWMWLEQIDPLFTREMPPTDAAIRLYAAWIGKYMESHGEPNFQENFAVIADAASSTGSMVPDRLIFKVTKRRGRK
jgi:hypothetical protein